MPRYKAKQPGNNTRRARRRPATRLPGGSGDNPQRQKVDYTTSSIAPPELTRALTVRRLGPHQTLYIDSSGPNAAVINFALNGVYGSDEFQALYDLYRIDAIRMTVRPNNTGIDLKDPNTTVVTPIYWVIDYNDSTPLASLSQATEYENCMILSPGESGTRTFRPRYKMVAQSASGTDYVTGTSQWLQTASDDIYHFGVKFWCPAVAVGQTSVQTWTVTTEYFITFSQLK